MHPTALGGAASAFIERQRELYSGRFRVPVCEVSALRDSYIIPPHACKRGAL